jgi:hypothetical protein
MHGGIGKDRVLGDEPRDKREIDQSRASEARPDLLTLSGEDDC